MAQTAGSLGAAGAAGAKAEDDEEVPDLVENFDEPSKKEETGAGTTAE